MLKEGVKPQRPLGAQRLVGAREGGGTKRTAARSVRPGAPMRRLETWVDGLLVHALERPAERGGDRQTAVILIHGAGLDHRDWSFGFLKRIASKRRVIAFDRPGFGRSQRPGRLSVGLPGAQARILREAASRFGVRRAVIVGHSWGGAVAMSWGLDAPESVLGIASIAGAVAPWSFASTLRNGARMRSDSQNDEDSLATLERSLRTAFAPARLPKSYLKHIAPAVSRRTATSTLSDLWSINGALALMARRYGAMNAPVELLYGDSDEILSLDEQGRAAAELLPQARLSIFKGRGHMLHHSEPRACAAAIDRIFALSAR